MSYFQLLNTHFTIISNILAVQDLEELREGCNVCHRSTATISFVDLQCELMIYLVEKHVLSVTTFCGEIFKISILTDPMLLTKLRPELGSDYASVNKIVIDLAHMTYCCYRTGQLGS